MYFWTISSVFSFRVLSSNWIGADALCSFTAHVSQVTPTICFLIDLLSMNLIFFARGNQDSNGYTSHAIFWKDLELRMRKQKIRFRCFHIAKFAHQKWLLFCSIDFDCFNRNPSATIMFIHFVGMRLLLISNMQFFYLISICSSLDNRRKKYFQLEVFR
jgi:hypothetical protein